MKKLLGYFGFFLIFFGSFKIITWISRGDLDGALRNSGIFFTGLELAALAGVAVFSGNYSTKADEYKAANEARTAYEDQWNKDIPISTWDAIKQAELDAYDAQKEAMYGLIGSGTVAGVVWLWNIIDVKKSKSKSYSDNNRFSMGINQNGQVETRISF